MLTRRAGAKPQAPDADGGKEASGAAT
jgi:hypothetical protein